MRNDYDHEHDRGGNERRKTQTEKCIDHIPKYAEKKLSLPWSGGNSKVQGISVSCNQSPLERLPRRSRRSYDGGFTVRDGSDRTTLNSELCTSR
jgi:hypothetical protein